MSPEVLERKIAAIVTRIAELLDIDGARALNLFYTSNTYLVLKNEATDLHLRPDGYIVEEFLTELRNTTSDGETAETE